MDNEMKIFSINKMVKAQRNYEFSKSYQLSLGQLISELENLDLKYDEKEMKSICFDFGSAIPTTLDSYRGYYDELAIGYTLTGYDNNDNHFGDKKADEFLKELKATIGKEFTGWKGGEYTMDENTPLWIANPGNAGGTGVVGVIDVSWQIVILTAYIEN